MVDSLFCKAKGGVVVPRSTLVSPLIVGFPFFITPGKTNHAKCPSPEAVPSFHRSTFLIISSKKRSSERRGQLLCIYTSYTMVCGLHALEYLWGSCIFIVPSRECLLSGARKCEWLSCMVCHKKALHYYVYFIPYHTKFQKWNIYKYTRIFLCFHWLFSMVDKTIYLPLKCCHLEVCTCQKYHQKLLGRRISW